MSTSLKLLAMAATPLAQLLHQAGHNMLPAPASASVPVVQAEATILSQANRRKYLVAT